MKYAATIELEKPGIIRRLKNMEEFKTTAHQQPVILKGTPNGFMIISDDGTTGYLPRDGRIPLDNGMNVRAVRRLPPNAFLEPML